MIKQSNKIKMNKYMLNNVIKSGWHHCYNWGLLSMKFYSPLHFLSFQLMPISLYFFFFFEITYVMLKCLFRIIILVKCLKYYWCTVIEFILCWNYFVSVICVEFVSWFSGCEKYYKGEFLNLWEISCILFIKIFNVFCWMKFVYLFIYFL